MSLPNEFQWRYAFHFTLVDNLESILKQGILCTNAKKALGISHQNVADEGIQLRRSQMHVPCSPGKVVHDFVPFYFSKKTSMQLNIINKKNIDQQLLIYFAIPIKIMESLDGVVFSDASANTTTPPNFYNKLQADKLETLNWLAIDDKKWGCPSEAYRQQKMAELLIPNKINISQIGYIVVWNEGIKKEVERIFKENGVSPPQIKYDTDHYYVNFYDGDRQSIVTGPLLLIHKYKSTIEEICNTPAQSTKFNNVKEALGAINLDFSAIKELADIDGLKASYGPHSDEVGTHSKKVASNVIKHSEYTKLSEADKNIVMLSAFLHDIGKGPKSRWPTEGMTKADNDHAVKSLPMLKRILTEDIGGLDRETIRKIVMLVTYDDLIGDIVAKGRDEKQLFSVIESENDLNMLVALGKADMLSINSQWPSIHHGKIELLKGNAIKSLTEA
ncbi:DarT ssDNA thymidine ADP-ribosyltransferase family protein [Pseudomonas moraviensis]